MECETKDAAEFVKQARERLAIADFCGDEEIVCTFRYGSLVELIASIEDLMRRAGA